MLCVYKVVDACQFDPSWPATAVSRSCMGQQIPGPRTAAGKSSQSGQNGLAPVSWTGEVLGSGYLILAFCPPLWGGLLVRPRASFHPGLHVDSKLPTQWREGPALIAQADRTALPRLTCDALQIEVVVAEGPKPSRTWDLALSSGNFKISPCADTLK